MASIHPAAKPGSTRGPKRSAEPKAESRPQQARTKDSFQDVPIEREDVRLHVMPTDGAAPIIAAINRAQYTIELSVYDLSHAGVKSALAEAAARGVRVRVLLEDNPQHHQSAGSQFGSIQEELGRSSMDVKATPFGNSRLDHQKYMIIDGDHPDLCVLLAGTGNLGRSGLGENSGNKANNREFWIEDARAVTIADAKTIYNADWNGERLSDFSFETLVVSPEDTVKDLVNLINSARTSLCVYNQAIRELGSKDIQEALIAAAARGVDVRVLISDRREEGEFKYQETVDILHAAGVQATFFRKHYLHAKAILVDHETAFVGSQNFTLQGLKMNRELGVVTNDPDVVAELRAIYDEDWAVSAPDLSE